MTVSVILILVMLLLSAFFSGMEIAFVSKNRLKLEIDRKQSGLLDFVAKVFERHPGQYITSILVGNNIALVVYSLYMSSLLRAQECHRKETNMKQPYIPQPIDVSRIELPAALAPLTEALARNVHEVWAATRIAQGWRFGPERNDARKEHPCLIPYEELPEEERTYDRQTALETLKLIEHLGFEIRKR